MARIRGPKVFRNPDTGRVEAKMEVSLTGTPEAVHQGMIDDAHVADETPLVSASAYTQRTKSRMAAMEAAKAPKVPVGTAPPLDPDKMRELSGHVIASKAGMAAPSFPRPPGLPDQESKAQPPRPRRPPPPPVHGVGSNLAYNQALARGEIDKPMTMADARQMEDQVKNRRLSPEAAAAIEQHTAPAENPPPMFPPEEAPEDPKVESPKVAEDVQDKIDETERELTQAALFDQMQLQQIDEVRMMLIDPKRKKLIESRLEPLDFLDVVMNREVKQHIPVIPDKFSLTLRTVQQFENLYCLQRMYGIKGSQAYIEEMLNTYRIACALVAINGSPLPDYRKEGEQDVDDKLFDHKVEIVKGQATPIIAEVSVQYDWFILRVNQLLSYEAIKNG